MSYGSLHPPVASVVARVFKQMDQEVIGIESYIVATIRAWPLQIHLAIFEIDKVDIGKGLALLAVEADSCRLIIHDRLAVS